MVAVKDVGLSEVSFTLLESRSVCPGCFSSAQIRCSLKCVTFSFFVIQRLVCFMTDLQGADSLLQRAIKRVDESKVLDSAQVRYE